MMMILLIIIFLNIFPLFFLQKGETRSLVQNSYANRWIRPLWGGNSLHGSMGAEVENVKDILLFD